MIGSGHHLDRILDDATVHDIGKAPAHAPWHRRWQRFGWTPRQGESDLESQLRGDLINALGTLGDDKVVRNRARELFALYEKIADVCRAQLDPGADCDRGAYRHGGGL